MNGEAALFQGTRSGTAANYLTCRNPFLDAADNAGTLSFWVRPADNDRQVVFSGGQAGNYGDQWDYLLYSSGYMYWRWFYGNGSAYTVSGGGAPVNAWTHVALRWSESTWEIFRNGSRQNYRTDTDVDFRRGAMWRLGARFDWNNNGHYPYNGRLDEVYAWHRALTNDEIGQLYHSGRGLFMDRRAGEEPKGGYHGIRETLRAYFHDTPRRVIGTVNASAIHAGAWRVVDGCHTLHAASPSIYGACVLFTVETNNFGIRASSFVRN